MGFSPPEFENLVYKTERKNINLLLGLRIQAKRRPLGSYVSNEMSSILLLYPKFDLLEIFLWAKKKEEMIVFVHLPLKVC